MRKRKLSNKSLLSLGKRIYDMFNPDNQMTEYEDDNALQMVQDTINELIKEENK